MIRFIKDYKKMVRNIPDGFAYLESAIRENTEEQKKSRIAIEELCMSQEQFMKTLSNFLNFEQRQLIAKEKRQLEKENMMKLTDADKLY